MRWAGSHRLMFHLIWEGRQLTSVPLKHWNYAVKEGYTTGTRLIRGYSITGCPKKVAILSVAHRAFVV